VGSPHEVISRTLCAHLNVSDLEALEARISKEAEADHATDRRSAPVVGRTRMFAAVVPTPGDKGEPTRRPAPSKTVPNSLITASPAAVGAIKTGLLRTYRPAGAFEAVALEHSEDRPLPPVS
jgi:hypothetical protein